MVQTHLVQNHLIQNKKCASFHPSLTHAFPKSRSAFWKYWWVKNHLVQVSFQSKIIWSTFFWIQDICYHNDKHNWKIKLIKYIDDLKQMCCSLMKNLTCCLTTKTCNLFLNSFLPVDSFYLLHIIKYSWSSVFKIESKKNIINWCPIPCKNTIGRNKNNK